MVEKEVVLDVAKVKPGKVQIIRDLYQEIRSRRDETRDVLSETGVLAESAFLREEDDATYFITYIETADWERTQALYHESDHDLDQRHLDVLSESLQDGDWKTGELNPVLHIVASTPASN